MSSFMRAVSSLLKSSYFFCFIITIFLIESLWVALSSGFPMAFDEAYHFDLIKVYSHHIGPIFIHQPPGPAVYGALPQNTSFLYHYLMSFPYRLTSLFSQSQMIHVIVLRGVDIGLFGLSLILIRRVLLRTKAHPAVINLSILFFILIPIVPLLAGQVTYDDGMMLFVGLSLLLCVKFAEQIKKDNHLNLVLLLALLSVALLGCLDKFPFLPIFTGIVAYVVYLLWKYFKANKNNSLKKIKGGWQAANIFKKVIVIVFFFLSLGLWLDVYGYNLVRYKNPVPQCNQILSVQQCMSFDSWARNYADAKTNTGVDINPLRFSVSWIYGMFYRMFFTINGPSNQAYYENHVAPIVTIGSAVIVAFGSLLFLFRRGWRTLKKDWALSFLIFTSFIYLASLWARNYHDYLHLGKMVAINGRYLIPVILPVYLLIGMSYKEVLAKRHALQAAVLGLACLVYVEGGGIIGFVYYSNSAWYWPGDKLANKMNADGRKVASSFFISRKY